MSAGIDGAAARTEIIDDGAHGVDCKVDGHDEYSMNEGLQ